MIGQMTALRRDDVARPRSEVQTTALSDDCRHRSYVAASTEATTGFKMVVALGFIRPVFPGSIREALDRGSRCYASIPNLRTSGTGVLQIPADRRIGLRIVLGYARKTQETDNHTSIRGPVGRPRLLLNHQTCGTTRRNDRIAPVEMLMQSPYLTVKTGSTLASGAHTKPR